MLRPRPGRDVATRMTAKSGQSGEPGSTQCRLDAHMTFRPGDILSGTVLVEGGQQAIAFSGWLGLVETLTALGQVAP